MRLSAHGLSHRYGSRTALSGVGFSVQGGELLAVVGPNGAGKSTLLRRLSGTLNGPGVVLLDGQDLGSFSPRALARALSMLEQEVPGDLDFQVLTVVALGRHPHRARLGPLSPEDHRAVQWAMEAVGIRELSGRRFSQLSGGERRKVLLAAVLAQEPRVLLLDEPTAHLDVRHQLEIMGILGELAQHGRAVVCAMHDLNLAAAFAHRIALLQDGRVLAEGPPEEVLTPQALREAFGVEAVVERSPTTGSVHVHFLKNRLTGGPVTGSREPNPPPGVRAGR